jgi:hypothetical protein
MIPTFYDNIEISHDKLVKKFNRYQTQRGLFMGGVMIDTEAILTLIFVRFIYRLIKRGRGMVGQRGLAGAK